MKSGSGGQPGIDPAASDRQANFSVIQKYPLAKSTIESRIGMPITEARSDPVEMNGVIRHIRDVFSGRVYQTLAILFCLLFGIAMIVNVQLEGDAMWFLYARQFHLGTRLYADLHLPLQPLIILENAAWIRLFGIKVLVTEIPAMIHALVFSLAMFFILRESDWPDWQKAIVLASAFAISVYADAWRFDDFHIVMDTFTFFSVVFLLLLAKTDAGRQQIRLVVGLGILSGLAVTTRLNDGGALLVATGACLLVLARARKYRVASVFLVAAAVTSICVVKLTGDSFGDYFSNTVIRAAGAKGGTANILAGPYHLFFTSFHKIRGARWLFYWTIAMVATGAVVQHYWRTKFRYLVALQLGIAGFAYSCSSWLHRQELREGAYFFFAVYSAILVTYLLLPIVAAHYLASKMAGSKLGWNSREILILLPLAELASFSTSNTGIIALFLSPIALLLLLVPVLQPFRRQASWANATVVTIVALMGVYALADKIREPYGWMYFHAHPMFENRQWYRHPVYGPMYIDRDLLHFIGPICQEVEAGNPKPELFSTPFAYPNYFCATPPWHAYVQTFYDTVTEATMHHLIGELDTAPPQWIVYQRQIRLVRQAEQLFHNGQPSAHRELDNLITHKLVTGQWRVIERSDYLFKDKSVDVKEDGWYLIRTRP